MSTRTVTWTMSTWEQRGSAEYVPIDRHIGNLVIDAYGRRSDTAEYGRCAPRRPYRTEEADGVAYIMYDNDHDGTVAVPIIRIEDAAEDTAENLTEGVENA